MTVGASPLHILQTPGAGHCDTRTEHSALKGLMDQVLSVCLLICFMNYMSPGAHLLVVGMLQFMT